MRRAQKSQAERPARWPGFLGLSLTLPASSRGYWLEWVSLLFSLCEMYSTGVVCSARRKPATVSCPQEGPCVRPHSRIPESRFRLALLSAGSAQVIHGREGITLPPPPVVDAIPVADDYFAPKSQTVIAGLKTPRAPRRAPSSTPRIPTLRAISSRRASMRRYWTTWTRSRCLCRQSLPHPARQRLFLQEAAGRRTAILDLRAPRLAGAGCQPVERIQRLIDPASLGRDPNTSVLICSTSRAMAR